MQVGLARLDRRFAGYELKIRRLQRDDPSFRELCKDYEEAVRALAYWQYPPHRSVERAEEYRRLVIELEAEIKDVLRGQEET